MNRDSDLPKDFVSNLHYLRGLVSNESFNQLLNIFWLRPETALWRYLDINTLRDFEFVGHSLDFGCGDGLFSPKGKNVYSP